LYYGGLRGGDTVLQIITRSRLLLAFFAIALSAMAASALAPLLYISEEYFVIDYEEIYSHKYYDVVKAISRALLVIFPAIVGLASD